MHRFTISSCETLLQFNNNLSVQFNEGKGYQGEKRKYVRQIIYTNQGHSPTKVTLDINFADKPVVQYDVPVVENIFVDDCK